MRGRPRRARGGERQAVRTLGAGAEAATGGRHSARRAGERRLASGPRAGGAGELAVTVRVFVMLGIYFVSVKYVFVSIKLVSVYV
jgi:hypothetical protein